MNGFTPEEEHGWVLSRIVAHAAGFLNTEEETRFREHLLTCEDCRNAHVRVSAGFEQNGLPTGHIPSSMLSRWDTTGRTLRGLERYLVRRHLERCEECRQDLELLGFEPVLEHVPELEPAPGLLEGIADQGEHGEESSSQAKPRDKTGSYEIRVIHSTDVPRSKAWRRWALGGWTVAASAAAIVLFILFGTDRFPSGRYDAGGGAIPWVTPTLVRGGENKNVLEISAETTSFLVAVRVPHGRQRDSNAFVDVYSPKDALLSRSVFSSRELTKQVVMVVLSMRAPIEPGSYRVEFYDGEPSGTSAMITETWFDIKISDR